MLIFLCIEYTNPNIKFPLYAILKLKTTFGHGEMSTNKQKKLRETKITI